MEVLGMRSEKYIGESCKVDSAKSKSGYSVFTYEDEERERYYVYLKEGDSLYELLLDLEERPCHYELEEAEYLVLELKEISELPENILKSKIKKEFDMVDVNLKSYSCDFFSFDRIGLHYGGSPSVPFGTYEIVLSLFR